MKQNNTTNDAKVGLFVSLGITAVLISILVFGGDRMFFSSTYRLRLQLKDVQGLAPGSVVSLAGLRVGNVKDIEFNTEANKLEVILSVERKFQNKITTDASATIKTQGALGDRFIYIDPHAAHGEILKENSLLFSADSPDIFEMITAKGAEFGNILEVIKEVRVLLHSLNENGRSSQFMENMVLMSQNMNSLAMEAKLALREVRGTDKDPQLKQTMTSLHNVLKKIDQGDGTLGALINDPSLHDRLMSFLGETPRNKFMKSLIRQSIQDGDRK